MRRGQNTSAKQVGLTLRQIEVLTAQGKCLALARRRRSPSRATTAGAVSANVRRLVSDVLVWVACRG